MCSAQDRYLEGSSLQLGIDVLQPHIGGYWKACQLVTGYDSDRDTILDDANSTEGGSQKCGLTRSSRCKPAEGFDHSLSVEHEHYQHSTSIMKQY